MIFACTFQALSLSRLCALGIYAGDFHSTDLSALSNQSMIPPSLRSTGEVPGALDLEGDSELWSSIWTEKRGYISNNPSNKVHPLHGLEEEINGTDGIDDDGGDHAQAEGSYDEDQSVVEVDPEVCPFSFQPTSRDFD